MLTKRQLEDMSNNSVSWNLKDAAQTALAYRAMLERLEWCGIDYENRTESCCPICGGWQKEGHIDDCELGNMLKESEGEEG